MLDFSVLLVYFHIVNPFMKFGDICIFIWIFWSYGQCVLIFFIIDIEVTLGIFVVVYVLLLYGAIGIEYLN